MNTNSEINNKSAQSTSIPSLKNIERQWYFINLKDKTLGRVAAKVASILRGKNKNIFTPNLDLGDYVVLVNAKYANLTGNNKLENKYYYNHSGYPGGLRKRSTKVMLESFPEELVRRVTGGMLPHNKLGRNQIKRLFIFPTDSHNLLAQQKYFIDISTLV